MRRLKAIPAPGALVRDPATGEVLPAEGRTVPDDAFWRRRARAGDVTLASAADAPTRERRSRPAPKTPDSEG